MVSGDVDSKRPDQASPLLSLAWERNEIVQQFGKKGVSLPGPWQIILRVSIGVAHLAFVLMEGVSNRPLRRLRC